ncbi:MAG: DUF1553 domain-containing protein, partial [Planctomycetales bacterium]
MTDETRRELDAVERPVLMKHSGGEGFVKFTPDLKAMLMKRPEDRSPLERQLSEMAERQIKTDRKNLEKHLKGEEKERWEQLRKQLASFDDRKPSALPTGTFGVSDVGAAAPPVLIPGKEQRGEIKPGFLSVLDESDATIEFPHPALESTGRRTALAKWIADPNNPLTTRVIVNRAWQYYFGVGLTANSSDFGRLGEPPSHPKLLDWLASRFVEGGWRFKSLHRLIVTSAVYRQTALRDDPDAMRIDPSNRLLWRQGVRRLDAERLRDAILATTGELDSRQGGAAVSGTTPRRSIYVKVMRNSADPLLKTFDAPDGLSSVPTRNATTTAMQALLLLNSKWPLERAERLAARLRREAPKSDAARIRRAYQLCFSRSPSERETEAALRFLGDQRKHIDATAAKVAAKPKPPEPAVVAREFPETKSDAAEFSSSGAAAQLTASHESLPDGDFTIEAFVLLRTLHEDASVRTIASHWDSNQNHPGWSFGVTSKKSRYQPRNLILQLAGRTGSGQARYEVIPSGLRLELNQPYYVAAAVSISETGEEGVTFHVKRLNGDAALQTARAKHEVVRGHRPEHALRLGGRHGKGHAWDGLLDDVRLSRTALSPEELLIHA